MTKSDAESATEQSRELKRKKRMKCLAYVAAFAIFQTAIILVFAFTVMRIKNPKFRIRSVVVEDLTYNTSTPTPSFNMKLIAEVTVKNTNFGHYKFEDSSVTFAYKGSQVGEASVTKARARARSTKKMNVTTNLNSDGVAKDLNADGDLSSGFLTLTSHSKLNGKVHLMKVIKKKKFVEMNCTMTVNLAEKMVQDIKCD